jgi:hypothetical protein
MKQPSCVLLRRLGLLVVVFVMAACSGENEPLPTYTIGGTVSGLDGTVVLLNNGTDQVSVSGVGGFTFATPIKRGQSYSVTIDTQPTNQRCTVANATGIAAEDVTNVLVNCIDTSIPTYTIGGTAVGVKGQLVLRNGPELLPVNSPGPFTFATRVVSGTSYSVTIETQPDNQSCHVGNGSGTVGTANVTDIVVTCRDIEPSSYSIGGTVSGLDGEVTLRNGNENLKLGSNGGFTFATRLESGATYDVSVAKQPSGQTCAVANGSGTVTNSDVTNVLVTCESDAPPPADEHSIGGKLNGLTEGTLRLGLASSGGQGRTLDLTQNGPFSFDPERVADGDTYSVTVVEQPEGQSCAVTNGTGTATADVSDVSVDCDKSTAAYTVGGSIEGLTGSGLVVEQDTGNAAQPDVGATEFTLPQEFADGDVYDVGIASQPQGQTCVVRRSHGAVAAADVRSVEVRCVDNATDPLVGTYAVTEHGRDGLAYLTLFADGVYVYGSVENDPGCGSTTNGNGAEYGAYDYDASTGDFVILGAAVDTNGSCGVWDGASRLTGALEEPRGRDKPLKLDVPGRGTVELVPVDSKKKQLFGSYADAYERSVWIFTDAGHGSLYVFNVQTQADEGATSQGYEAGVEYACATLVGSPENGTLLADFTATCQAPAPGSNGAVDTNGSSGFSGTVSLWSYQVDGDLLVGSTFRGLRVDAR